MSSIRRRCSSTHWSGMIEAVPQTTAGTPAASAAKVRVSQPLSSVGPSGVYLHETFSQGNETVGKPSNPDFLLRPGELLEAVGALRVIGFEDGFAAAPDRYLQRIAAVREDPSTDRPRRWSLPVG